MVYAQGKKLMSRNIVFLWAILSLFILPFAYAEDKSAAPQGEKPSFFGVDKPDKPAKKKVKKSKEWYPFAKDKKWYSFVGQSSAPQAGRQPGGQEQAQEQEEKEKKQKEQKEKQKKEQE